MRILVTGPTGFVGARVMASLPAAVPAPSLRAMTDDDIKRMVERVAPDAIIHTAAISDIGSCARHPQASLRANVEIPVALAQTGVKCVLFSTDQVYGGCREEGPYREETAVPANLYAEHKLEMERRVTKANPDAVLLRATWMYDMPLYGVANRGNFLTTMLRGAEGAFSATQRRGISYVREVAAHMEQALRLPGGVYNFGSETMLTMLQTARWLKERLHLPIELTDAGDRHDLWMDCGKLRREGIAFDDTVRGLERCIGDYALA